MEENSNFLFYNILNDNQYKLRPILFERRTLITNLLSLLHNDTRTYSAEQSTKLDRTPKLLSVLVVYMFSIL